MICRGNLGQRSADDEDLVRGTVRTPNRGDVNADENTIKNGGNTHSDIDSGLKSYFQDQQIRASDPKASDRNSELTH